MKRRSLIFALGMVVLLVLFWIRGDNAVVYVISLLGVPIVSGVVAGLRWIRFWLAAWRAWLWWLSTLCSMRRAQRTPGSSLSLRW
jgi:hypothetical protein